jgi:DNA-binding CsgD family transcriptional regulator
MHRKLFVEPPVTLGDTIALMASGIELTERERQLCTMLMRGATPKSISESLGIARRTVYKHISNIHAKLGVSSQTELLAKLSESAARGRSGVLSNQS